VVGVHEVDAHFHNAPNDVCRFGWLTSLEECPCRKHGLTEHFKVALNVEGCAVLSQKRLPDGFECAEVKVGGLLQNVLELGVGVF
jgi:hypothetical protein